MQERTDAILKDLRGRISALSDGLYALGQQARQLSFDFVEEERRLDDLKPLRRQYVKKIKSQIQQLEELNYLNDLIAYLESSEKEIVLLPCRHGPKGEVFPCESDSTDSFHDLSLAELGESYREFSSDESATGLW